MSALPPKADMCGATRDVRFGPKADIIGNFQNRAGWPFCRPALPLSVSALAAAAFLQLCQNLIEREAAGLLSRWKFFVGFQMLGHELLRRHEYEHAFAAPPGGVSLAPLRPLKRISPHVHDLGQAKRHGRVLPYVDSFRTLLQE